MSPEEPLFLDIDDVIELHATQLAIFAGCLGFAIVDCLSRLWRIHNPPSAENSSTTAFLRWRRPTSSTL